MESQLEKLCRKMLNPNILVTRCEETMVINDKVPELKLRDLFFKNSKISDASNLGYNNGRRMTSTKIMKYCRPFGESRDLSTRARVGGYTIARKQPSRSCTTVPSRGHAIARNQPSRSSKTVPSRGPKLKTKTKKSSGKSTRSRSSKAKAIGKYHCPQCNAVHDDWENFADHLDAEHLGVWTFGTTFNTMTSRKPEELNWGNNARTLNAVWRTEEGNFQQEIFHPDVIVC